MALPVILIRRHVPVHKSAFISAGTLFARCSDCFIALIVLFSISGSGAGWDGEDGSVLSVMGRSPSRDHYSPAALHSPRPRPRRRPGCRAGTERRRVWGSGGGA